MPQNYVTWITQSNEGFLLVATSGGVARFDGRRFTMIPLDPKTGLTREWINVVVAASDGSLWIASRDAGLFLHRAGLTKRLERPSSALSYLAEQAGGRLIGVGGSGVFELTSDGARELTAQVTSADPSWQGLLTRENGTLLVATQAGLVQWGPKGSRIVLPSTGATGKPLAIARGAGGRLWVGAAQGLYRAAPDLALPLTRVAGVPGPVVSIVEDRDGVVWAATWGQGLYRVTRDGAASFTTRDGLPDDFVHTLFEDREGNLWIGTRGGLSRWKSGPLAAYGPPEGVPGQFFSAVAGDRDGRLYLGTWRSGLYEKQGSSFRRLPLDEPDFGVLVRALAPGGDRELWVADWNSGLACHNQSGWRRYAAPELGFLPVVRSLARDPAGTLWVGAASGLYRYPQSRIVPGVTPLLAGNAVAALLMTRTGALFAGTTQGLFRITPESTQPVGLLPHPTVTSLSEDTQGRLWVTTRANGICLIATNATYTFDQRHGLPALPIFGVLDDGIGSLWLSSPSGIYRLPAAQVEEVASSRRQSFDVEAYDQNDGMRSIECQGVGQPTAWKDSAGDLWFPTVRGMIRIRPRDRRSLPPPAVLLEAVESAPDSHVVRFTAARLAAPESIEFRYRLDEAPAGWTHAGNDRLLRFSRFSAGAHRLEIAARQRGGEWGAPTVVTLSQIPAFHETGWFRLLLVALAASLVYLLVRWRLYLQRGRYQAVLAERNRLAREWHDTLLAGFSALSWQLDSTLNKLPERPDAAAASVETARQMVQHYRAEARRVIWDLRHEEPEPESLPHALQAALTELTRNREIATSLSQQGPTTAISGATAQNLLRICQEAAANALRHGEPRSLEVLLSYGADSVRMTVRDDGAGFDPERLPPGHFGIEIMQERARRIGGTLEIVSHPGAGTSVSVTVPYSGSPS
ncbi:MAG: histidine kinase [Bryobacter sp.]|nr:histidine kinase [Bryobacter sp.]